MTRKRSAKQTAVVPEAALDALIGTTRTTEELEELFRAMKKRVVERMLGAELSQHLGYGPGEEKPAGQANHRNGTTPKTVLTDDGALPLAVPRDRAGTFEPQLIPKGVRRLPGFDAKVLSLYARGMTVREIQGHLEELYQVAVAADVISTVTDAVLAEVTAWQQRPLERVYPVVIFDALRVKIRDEGVVRNKAVYLAIGITREGARDVLGLWIELTEGAAFWLRVMTELQSRGVEDILIALIDGLVGFPEAITTVFPQTQVHHCMVHLTRRSLQYVNWKERRAVAADLRAIYQAPTEAAALSALTSFEASPVSDRYPPIAALWHRHWEYVRPVFAYPPAIRRLLYTTNAIESLHMQLRKIIKTRGHFPSDEAAAKLLFLALRNIIAKWALRPKSWTEAMPYLAALFGERFTTET
ncbi:MAG: IS256 family transposase [Gemmatimonadaceae bacterium]